MRELKPVKEHLRDFYKMTEGNEIRDILSGIWDCEVDSIWHAKSLVNSRINTHVAWISGFKFDVESQIKTLIEMGHSIPEI